MVLFTMKMFKRIYEAEKEILGVGLCNQGIS